MTRFQLTPTMASFALALCCGISWAQAPMTEAEVRKVDVSAQKITLKHGEITNLNMPPMTMVFGVTEGKLLTAVKAGDQVRFAAEKINGAYVVTALEVNTAAVPK